MLDTLIDIGRTFRKDGRLQHHRYVKQPLVDKKTTVRYISLPVLEDFSFDFEGIREVPENQQHRLFYLNFKTADSDSLKKYVFGDIFRSVVKDKEDTNFQLGSPENVLEVRRKNSFLRGEEDSKFFKDTTIEKYRESFLKNYPQIEKILKENTSVFLHFDFQGKHWYQFEEEMSLINKKLLQEFISYQEDIEGYVLEKFLYKTLSAGGGSSPGFSNKAAFKNRFFADTDSVMDLLYAIDFSTKPVIRERDIKIIALPRGSNLKSEHIEDFFTRKVSVEEEQKDEATLVQQNKGSVKRGIRERMLASLTENLPDNIVQFDLVISKASSSPSSPDVDLIEISSIERSFLEKLHNRIKKFGYEIEERRNELYPKRPKQFQFLNITTCFLNILGDMTKDKKKYQSHLLKVLPQIYMGTYYQDDVLLPAFIEKVEFSVRSDTPNFNLLQFDYEFLLRLQNSPGDKMEEMHNDKSYQIGKLLGKMAQPLRKAINSFEKNYVGLLSRRISDKQGLMKFANFINEKLAIHEVAYPSLKQAFAELTQLLPDISEKQYNKNYCAFGFFEGYYSYSNNKQDAPNEAQTEQLTN